MSTGYIQVASPPREVNGIDGKPVSVAPATYQLQALESTWSWGLQPGRAVATWVATVPVPFPAFSVVTIVCGGHLFYGVATNLAGQVSSAGNTVTQEFQDMRMLLQYDQVFGRFNVKDERVVGNRWVKRYKHLLPVNCNAGLWTYTTNAYTAAEICEFLFTAPTLETAWVREYCPAMSCPVFDVDFDNGTAMGTALTQVSGAAGAVFTLMGGAFRLVWCVKGVGDVPAFPGNSDNRRYGTALSGNPSRVTVLGDRNVYQVLNIALRADWLTAWEDLWGGVDMVAEDIFDNESLDCDIGDIVAGTRYNAISADAEHIIGRELSQERAMRITVGEYANLRDQRNGTGERFRDYRWFAGRTRLSMPVAMYLSELMFRAYRVPPDFTLGNLPLESLEVRPEALAEVSFDPRDGTMDYDIDDPATPGQGGLMIVQGIALGTVAESFRQPERIRQAFAALLDARHAWHEVSYTLDSSGAGDQVLITSEPLIFAEDLLAMDDTGLYPVPKARPTFTTPQCQAALTFNAERYRLVRGSIGMDHTEQASGLCGQFLLTPKNDTYPNGLRQEILFVDGENSRRKGERIANALLGRPFFYVSGGYTVRGSNATQLTSVIDRVTLRYGVGGMTEEVDFTAERYRPEITPERNFERLSMLQRILPEQESLKQQSAELQAVAFFDRVNPKWLRQKEQSVRLLRMMFDPTEHTILRVNSGSGTLAPGTPLFKANGTVGRASTPATSTAAATPVFAGATVLKGQDAAKDVVVRKHGMTLLRVKGPVQISDGVCISDGQNYLIAGPHDEVGRAKEAIADESVKLIMVAVGTGGEEQKPVWV